MVKIYKLLFIESYDKCSTLGLLIENQRLICEYDGRKYFNREKNFFKKYDLVIASNYVSSLSNLICCKCREVGVETIFFTDGVYDLANSLRHPLLINSQRKLYGYLPFDNFASVSDIPLYAGETNFIRCITERIIKSDTPMKGLINNKRVLITTANTAYFTGSERARLAKLISDLALYLHSHDVEYAFRIFDTDLLSDVHREGVLNDISIPFEECLESYSHVITTPSSIVLASIYHAKATAQLIYRSEPPSISTAWNIPSIEIFSESFESFMTMEESRMSFQANSIRLMLEGEKPEVIVEGVLKQKQAVEFSEFRKSEAERILDSSLNFNLEYLARKIFENKRMAKLAALLRRIARQ